MCKVTLCITMQRIFLTNTGFDQHTAIPECPKCHSKSAQRIPRGFMVKNCLFWLPIKHFVCANCNKKMYAWVNNHPAGKLS